ncbi:MAG: TM0106 family RecB-like putative nuclease, partial [Cyclobacteriaceae bacterium]|nr:TM0106 family RecB-like putative nuclease [Cyclobacteriaceae bacterium]
MRFENDSFIYAASDLSTHVACKHASQLDRQHALKEIKRPYRDDSVLEALRQRGAEHEAAYVAFLKSQGKTATDSSRKSFEATLDAMREGKDVIVQGKLVVDNFEGFPDILIRVEGKSRFGDWCYEVQDTKLSRNTKTTTIIQLCFYSDLLEKIQEASPRDFHVVMPGDSPEQPFQIENYTLTDFKAYYGFIKSRFIEAMKTSPIATYPDEVPHCAICNWWSMCDTRRRADDHLCLVAGIHKSQIEELKKQDLTTLKLFALANDIKRPERGNYEILRKRQRQAKIQLDGRQTDNLIHQPIFPIEEKLGFNRLPEPSPGDIYLDIEGDAFFPGGSFEYLFGIAYREDGKLQYKKYWATNRVEEKQVFAQVMHFILDRLKKYSGLSIYHYGAYEPTTVKRLANGYAVFDQELDDLLRKEKFVDLHKVVKEAVIASVEQYSLKDMERFTGFTRKADLREAAKARKLVESALQLKEFAKLPGETVELVATYNEDDCLATEALHRWLEGERQKLVEQGHNLSRPVVGETDPDEDLTKLETWSKNLFEALTQGLPEDREQWQGEHHARWLLANQLQYFRRENKSAWWDHFRLQKGEYEDLLSDRSAIVGLAFQETITPGACPVHRYTFPDQETSLREGDKLYIANSFTPENPYGVSCGQVVAIDNEKNIVDIKKTKATAEIHPTAVHEYDIITIKTLWEAILGIASEVDDNGLSPMGDYFAAKDLLMKRKPRLINKEEGVTIKDGETRVQAACRIALNLNRSILPIQGPPGTGKTYTGARIVLELLKAKKKVGVTAVSHRVVMTLFEAINEQAREAGVDVQFVHKGTKEDRLPWVKELKKKKEVLDAADGVVFGGTAWLWADNEVRGALDYLIIDEAGQMSLSQALAASRAAKNLILLGDPQQLEQPQRGAHPENSGIAALTHLLDGDVVMPEGKGLFLNETRRIHPAIAQFTSEIFYKGQLGALPGLENQSIQGGTRFDGAGLFYVPVEHTANQNRSSEEIQKIQEIVDELLAKGSWTNAKKEVAPLTADDLLIVAPYNAQ